MKNKENWKQHIKEVDELIASQKRIELNQLKFACYLQTDVYRRSCHFLYQVLVYSINNELIIDF